MKSKEIDTLKCPNIPYEKIRKDNLFYNGKVLAYSQIEVILIFTHVTHKHFLQRFT